MAKNDDHYIEILLEDIRDQNRAVVEAVGQIQDTVRGLARAEDLDRVESKIDTIQAAVTDTNEDLGHLTQRVSDLEQAA